MAEERRLVQWKKILQEIYRKCGKVFIYNIIKRPINYIIYIIWALEGKKRVWHRRKIWKDNDQEEGEEEEEEEKYLKQALWNWCGINK